MNPARFSYVRHSGIFPRMNRWYLGAHATLTLGLGAAFLVVPHDDGACPTNQTECVGWGNAPRLMTIIVTIVLTLILVAVGVIRNAER